MEKPDAKDLLANYLAGKSTEEEAALLESWHLDYELDDVATITPEDQSKDLDEVWNALEQRELVSKRIVMWPKMAVAAAVILVTGLALFFYLQQSKPVEQITNTVADIPPGKNDAVLTLSNGQKIVLNETGEGEIASQAGISITKDKDGTIVYHSNASAGAKLNSGELLYNTITTPRGGKYQLNLPDGSKVWLNAGSSLKYPVVFAENERRVELSGEAYFEVSKDKKRPFYVNTDRQGLKVLGTHFNINAFRDEPETTTTLLEGSVKIIPVYKNVTNLALRDVVLSPGQQSVVGRTVTVSKANLEEAISWKNGMFQFNDTDLSSVMRQASRWYDVDVVYKGGVPAIKFSGEVSRNVNASAFLDMLKYLDIKFSIENVDGRKRIVVSR
ncbi:FecR family protein [Pedobacter nyackensis]|uniref:FecR family protein n=1 Tax=Pedobacter nyackensis TaxID=475255 RepID=A0A1W2ACB4_9SPHI|nr:FecR family protein [Pedobacter nyackensis]SMC58365.1 FecR family protein [Pedobacter nyackensis]